MRTYGILDEIHYRLQGWDIHTLAYRYRIFKDEDSKLVYVDNHKQLKAAIAEFALELMQYDYEDDESFMDE